jgi:hypothetical protein
VAHAGAGLGQRVKALARSCRGIMRQGELGKSAVIGKGETGNWSKRAAKVPSPIPPHRWEGLNPAAPIVPNSSVPILVAVLIWAGCLVLEPLPLVGRGWGGDFSLIYSHTKPPCAKIRRRVWITLKSGGPHAGFASGIGSKKGGAARARPETRRMMSASDRRCLAAHGAGLSTCPSSGLSARIAPAAAWTDRGCGFRGSGTDPDRRAMLLNQPRNHGAMKHIQHIMSATGPHRSCSPHTAFRQLWSKIPARWLALHVSRTRPARQRNPDGHRLLPRSAARYRRSRKAFLPHGRNVRDPSGSGSARMMT